MKIDEKTIEKMFEEWWSERNYTYTHSASAIKHNHFLTFKAAINLLLPIIQKQDEAIGFYSAKKNWGYSEKPKDQSHLAWIIERRDCGYCPDNEKFVGGKLARSTKQEVSEMINRLGGEV